MNHDKLNSLIPNDTGFPSSRDHVLDNVKCLRIECIVNVSGYCISPALISIGKNGQCKAFKKKSKKDSKK
jgi:hypothetical protein